MSEHAVAAFFWNVHHFFCTVPSGMFQLLGVLVFPVYYGGLVCICSQIDILVVIPVYWNALQLWQCC